MKSQLIGEDPDAGKDWGQEKKGVTEDKIVGWHYWLYGKEFEQTPGDSGGQGSLAYCSPWGCKESMWLNDWATTTICFYFLDEIVFWKRFFFFFNKCLVEFTSETIWAWYFLFWKSTIKSLSLIGTVVTRLCIFSWCEFGSFCLSRNFM